MSRHSFIISNTEAEYFGPEHLNPTTRQNFTAVINSRQSRTPKQSDNWVKMTLKAIESVNASGYCFLNSAGINTYELSACYCNTINAYQTLILPRFDGDNINKIISGFTSDFCLNPEKTGFLFINRGKNRKKIKTFYPLRDELIIKLSDMIYPVSIRKGGNLDSLLTKTVPAKINRQFSVAYKKPAKHPPFPDKSEAALPDNYFIHWVRSFYGPYPGETSADYYHSVITAKANDFNEPSLQYSHSAFYTLLRILKTGILQASNQGIKGGYPAIAFTSLTLNESLQQMKWVKSRVRYEFEPFGIAVHRDELKKIGLRPVIYGEKTDYLNISEEEKPYFQYRGKSGQWMEEKEWRLRNSLDLQKIPAEKITAITLSPESARILKYEIPDVKIISLT